MRFVIDASTAVRWYIGSLSHPHSDSVLKRFLAEPERFAIPELFSYELLNVLYRIHPDAAMIYEKDVNQLLHSGILRYPMTNHIFGRADRFITMGLTGYDACYVALAEELGASWLTFDSKACRCLLSRNESNLALDLNMVNPFPE